MYFKKIYMHGFKSFAEPVTVEFNPGVTCIVGPNGSGKSNISDAIRWVLGEQSPKTLRGSKMEEIIFAGTASRKSRGMAEVTLVIDNSTGILPTEYNEVAITRRMYRSGESEYSINNNPCRLRDIRNLIMDTGIGVDGYSIIGQGKIADIISGNADSRREVFEEAAGVVAYRSKKAEAMRKLENTENNMDRVTDIISEIEGRIDGLKEDSEKAQEYLKLRESSKDLEINITLKSIESTEFKLETYKDDIMEIEADIIDARERKDEIDAKTREAKDTLKDIQEKLDEASGELMSCIQVINSTDNELRVKEERMTAIADNLSRLDQEISDREKKEEETRSELEELKRQEESSLARKEQAEEELRLCISRQADKLSIAESNAAAMDAKRAEIQEKQNAISASIAQAEGLDAVTENDRERMQWLQSEEGGSSSALEDMRKEAAALEKQRSELAEKLDAAGAAVRNARISSNEKNQLRIDTSAHLQKRRTDVINMEARMKTLEELESSYEGYRNVVRFVMKSGLPGIECVVADMLDVPEGYETAVETALGQGLQNIVCRDQDSARNAIDELKRHNAGRATFLPVNSIRPSRINEKELADIRGEKGFLGLASDLAGHDSRYDDIVSYLLGRTVIVDDIRNAIAISRRVSSFRLVTLEGDVINTSGAMTGGRYKNKTANILGRKSEISQLEDKIHIGKKQMKRLADELDEIDSELQKLRQEISENEESMHRFELDIAAKESEISNLNTLIEAQVERDERRQAEIDAIRQRIDENTGKAVQVRESIESDTARMDALEKELEEDSLAYQENRREWEALSQAVTAARIKANTCEGELSNVRDIRERVESDLKTASEEKAARSAEVSSLTEEKLDISSRMDELSSALEEHTSKRQRTEGFIEELKEEKAGLDKLIDESSAEREEITSALETLQENSHQAEIRKTKAETQLENYKNKLWEDFEISYLQALSYKDEDFVLSRAVRENRAIRNRIKELGDVNVGAIEEYKQVSERYEFMTEQRDDISKAADSLKAIIEDMDRTIKQKFKENFNTVMNNFEEIFRELFGGGHANLYLADENDPLESAIEIEAQPPGKKLQNINLLSGGEKTMTAIALMFAVLKAKPTPFCILDEVEAALDDANIDRFADYLRKFDNIQFALITHQKATMEHADVLYGVTMPEQGVSRLLSLRMGDDFALD